ncbi:MAG: hypothetical protein OXF86_01280 [Caldilineaceae bacterium]|nr:hypothetical protein [Caldilineaceae bacterium]
MQHVRDEQSTMKELLTLTSKAPAPNLNSVPSSDAGLFLTFPRSYWSIRNAAHRVLDDDDLRIRHGHAQHNPAVLRRLALNLLSREKSAKTGIAAKRKRAGWKTGYLCRVLSQ